MTWSAEFSVDCVAPATGAALRLLTTVGAAHTAVEVGTGLGVSALWMLQGLPPDAILTSIDTDVDHQNMARQAFAAAGHHPSRTRLITGRAETMLTRLADNAYDLALIDCESIDRDVCVDVVRRLLRPGGLLVIHRPADDDRARLADWSPVRLLPELLGACRPKPLTR